MRRLLRGKLGDPAHGTRGLQPGCVGRVRLQRMFPGVQSEGSFLASATPFIVRRLLVRGTNVHNHDDPNWSVEPECDCVVTDDFDLSLSERGILVGEVIPGVRMFPQAVDEVHDLTALDATSWNGFQQAEMHVNFMGPHEARLLLVELALKLLRSQPMCGVAVGQAGVDALLIIGIGSMSKVEKECRNLALLRR